MGNNPKLGKWAEQQALLLLQQHGFELIQANYHSRYGEIDLIVKRDMELVFVEVKARASTNYAQAIETISLSKQRKLLKTTLHFLQNYEDFQQCFCRFDVICFDFQQHFAKTIQYDFGDYPYDLQWIENAFTFDPEFINL